MNSEPLFQRCGCRDNRYHRDVVGARDDRSPRNPESCTRTTRCGCRSLPSPTFADAPNLPYILALVKETLRWRPAVPLGVPHSTTEEDWYEGIFIPKGAICFVNVWQCNHDPVCYGDDASSFNPERFLDEHGDLIPGPAETRDDGHSSYGFEWRACVGKNAANDALFVSMATVLWSIRLECPRDEKGKEMRLDMETTVDAGTVLYASLHLSLFAPWFRVSADRF